MKYPCLIVLDGYKVIGTKVGVNGNDILEYIRKNISDISIDQFAALKTDGEISIEGNTFLFSWIEI